MVRRTHALLALLQSVQTQPSHVVMSVTQSVVHQARFVARVPLVASKLLLEPPLAAKPTTLCVQEGEHCNAYQMRGPLIETGVVQQILLVVVRTRSG